MTITSRRPIVCVCGHRGAVEITENDQPYDGLWERHTLIGFTGAEITITSIADIPTDLLAALNPHCPHCGQTGKVKYT